MTTLPVDRQTRLRPLSATDADELYRLVDTNREYLRRWLPWLDSQRSRDDTLTFISSSNERTAKNECLILGIDHRDRLAGVTGFNHLDWANRLGDIGYWLAADLQGHGIVTACCRRLLRHAFETIELNRVDIPVAVENARSRAIPERLGFQLDGVLRDAEWLYDRWVDHAYYTLLRRDYLAARPSPGPSSGAD